ncbi:MAG: hypothetical protein ACTS1Z_13345 [Parasphingopyxis sp.]|uniref:hypothetical protein n=1 Tax=Parasphingopyxis sp. TaxID=1920299 RepID=UPI003FA00443
MMSFGGESSGIDAIIRFIPLFRISVKAPCRAPVGLESVYPISAAAPPIAINSGNCFMICLPLRCRGFVDGNAIRIAASPGDGVDANQLVFETICTR